MCSRVTALQGARQLGFMGLVKKHLHIKELARFLKLLQLTRSALGKSWHWVPSPTHAWWEKEGSIKQSLDMEPVWDTRVLTHPFIQTRYLYPSTNHWVGSDCFCNYSLNFCEPEKKFPSHFQQQVLCQLSFWPNKMDFFSSTACHE